MTDELIPNLGTIIVVAMMLVASGALAAPLQQPVGPDIAPGVISYQGTLTSLLGTPVNGSVDIIFRLYSAPSGGVSLWTENHSGPNAVPVNSGLFNVLLGSLTPISPSIWNNSSVYLGVQVGTDPEMTPRELIGPVPVALVSNLALTVAEGSIQSKNLALSQGKACLPNTISHKLSTYEFCQGMNFCHSEPYIWVISTASGIIAANLHVDRNSKAPFSGENRRLND